MPHARLYDEMFDEPAETRKPLLEPFRQKMTSRSSEDAKSRFQSLGERFDAFTELMACVQPRSVVKPR